MYRNRRYNWKYESKPEPTLNSRRLIIDQGKVLGGSSSINGMLHVRGQKEEFNDRVQSGCAGWSYEELLPYYRKAETYRGNARTASALRGFEGPHVVSDPPTAHSLTRAFVEGAGDRHAIHCRDEWRVAKVLPIFSTTAPVAFAASRRRPTCESRARDRICRSRSKRSRPRSYSTAGEQW